MILLLPVFLPTNGNRLGSAGLPLSPPLRQHLLGRPPWELELHVGTFPSPRASCSLRKGWGALRTPRSPTLLPTSSSVR